MMVQIKGKNVLQNSIVLWNLKVFFFMLSTVLKNPKCYQFFYYFLKDQRPKSVIDYGQLSPDK